MPPLPTVDGRISPYYVSSSQTIYCGSCLEVLPDMAGDYDLVFLDPPFNIGQNYNGYNDRQTSDEYASLIGTSLIYAWGLTKGVICLHGPDNLIELWLTLINRHLPEMQTNRIAWVNWHYRFGQNTRSNWVDARCHCLIYAKSLDDYTWNPDEVLVASDRVAYGDKRVNETENGGMRVPGTVWGVPSDGPYWGRVQGNSVERRRHSPNQLPELYLARLLRAYTNVGDRVLDVFGGSGTTATVAQALGRRCDTIELSRDNCDSIIERLKKGAVRV